MKCTDKLLIINTTVSHQKLRMVHFDFMPTEILFGFCAATALNLKQFLDGSASHRPHVDRNASCNW